MRYTRSISFFSIVKRSLICFIILLSAQSKSQPKPVTVFASVISEDYHGMSNVMVINKRLGQGFIAEINGTFKTSLLRSDTLIILCTGYSDHMLSFRDSTVRDLYPVTIHMTKKVYKPKQEPVNPRIKPVNPKNNPHDPNVKPDSTKKDTAEDDYYDKNSWHLKQVTIYALKKPEEIRKEIESLGVENTNDYKSYSALSSPITALYERFSKREQDKRKVAELENADRKKEVLRDLLAMYISYDFIQLSEDEFEEFLNGLFMPDDFLKKANDYQIGEMIKRQYLDYKKFLKEKYDYNSTYKKFNRAK